MNWRTVGAIYKKDLIDASRNGVFIFLFLIPISLSWVYGSILTPGDLKSPRVVLFDVGGTSAFTDFVADMEIFELVAPPASWSESQDMVKSGRVHGAILLPIGFDAAFNSQPLPEIELYLDSSKTVPSALIQDGLRELIRIYAGQTLPANIKVEMVGEVTAKQASVPTWITIAILLAGINIVPTLLVEEKDKKTLDAILVTGTSRSEVILGKCLVGFTMAILMALIILVLNQGFIGNVLSLLVVLTLGSVSFVLAGLLIGSLAANVQVGSLISSLVLLPMVVGATMGDISPAISNIARFLPSYHLLDGIEQTMFLNKSLPNLWQQLFMLAMFASLSFFGSVIVLKRKASS